LVAYETCELRHFSLLKVLLFVSAKKISHDLMLARVYLQSCFIFRAYENETGQAPVRNITVAISFGAEHELSLEKKDSTSRHRHGNEKEDRDDKDKRSSNSSDGAVLLPLAARISVPQGNNCVFTIGRDVNIRFQHGIVEAAAASAATKQQQQQQECGSGRIGIILWGRIKDEQVKEDPGSPALLKREKSPAATAAAADTTTAAETAVDAGMETTTGETAVVEVE
jgi:hypothetical protein